MRPTSDRPIPLWAAAAGFLREKPAELGAGAGPEARARVEPAAAAPAGAAAGAAAGATTGAAEGTAQGRMQATGQRAMAVAGGWCRQPRPAGPTASDHRGFVKPVGLPRKEKRWALRQR